MSQTGVQGSEAGWGGAERGSSLSSLQGVPFGDAARSINESREPYPRSESSACPARTTTYRTPSVRPSERPCPSAWEV